MLAASGARAQSPAIQYVYDDLNRLIAVIDQDGNAATYTYDAVGNLLQIQRLNAADLPAPVAITLVTPGKGRLGTAVQIFGKGFGPGATENSLTFNGTPATVIVASPTRLETAVPAGAGTGPIRVTAPLGTATSPQPFTVLGVLTVSPTTASVPAGATQQFQAAEGETPTTNVRWAVNGVTGGDSQVGTISEEGLYTAPRGAALEFTVEVTATHKDDATLVASATVTIIPQIVFLVSRAVSVALAPPPLGIDMTVTASVSVQVAEPATSFAAAPQVTVALEPVITGVSPSNGARGASNLSLLVSGAGLAGATALVFLLNNLTDGTITVTDLTVGTDGREATATISIAAGAATGARIVHITTPAGSSTAAGTGGNLFTVQ